MPDQNGELARRRRRVARACSECEERNCAAGPGSARACERAELRALEHKRTLPTLPDRVWSSGTRGQRSPRLGCFPMPDFTTQILRVSEETSRSSGVLLDFLMKEWASEPSCELSSTAHAARPYTVVIRNAPEDVAPHGHAVDRATVRQRKT